MRTYPTPAKKGVEVSCTAGITDDGQWIRLYPVPYRLMDYDKRFKKYQWIDLNVTKASDPRPESYTPDIDSIRIDGSIGSERKWLKRKDHVFPLLSHCLCCLLEQRDAEGFPTLGFFKPARIERLRIEADDPAWDSKQLANLRQYTLFSVTPTNELEKIPFTFKYDFRCDHGTCSGHSISCTDWEMGASYRNWRRDYGDKWEEKFRQRYEYEMINLNDTHFYVGTLRSHPATWIIVGLFYPRR